MDKIIQENNKKLNRFNFNHKEQNEPFTELVIEDLEFDQPEAQNLENIARKALGRDTQNYNSV